MARALSSWEASWSFVPLGGSSVVGCSGQAWRPMPQQPYAQPAPQPVYQQPAPQPQPAYPQPAPSPVPAAQPYAPPAPQPQPAPFGAQPQPAPAPGYPTASAQYPGFPVPPPDTM